MRLHGFEKYIKESNLAKLSNYYLGGKTKEQLVKADHYCVPVYINGDDYWHPFEFEDDPDAPSNCKETAVWFYPYEKWNSWNEIELILKGKPYELIVKFEQDYYHDCEFWADARIKLSQEDAIKIMDISGDKNTIRVLTGREYGYTDVGKVTEGTYSNINNLISHLEKLSEISTAPKKPATGNREDRFKQIVSKVQYGKPFGRDWDGD